MGCPMPAGVCTHPALVYTQGVLGMPAAAICCPVCSCCGCCSCSCTAAVAARSPAAGPCADLLEPGEAYMDGIMLAGTTAWVRLSTGAPAAAAAAAAAAALGVMVAARSWAGSWAKQSRAEQATRRRRTKSAQLAWDRVRSGSLQQTSTKQEAPSQSRLRVREHVVFQQLPALPIQQCLLQTHKKSPTRHTAA